jgi:hypothetical protein
MLSPEASPCGEREGVVASLRETTSPSYVSPVEDSYACIADTTLYRLALQYHVL